VILADVFMPEKVKEGKVLDVDAVVSGINRQTGSDGARHVSGVDAIVELLLKESKSGDVFLFMSNGDFGGIGPRTLKALASKK
jgi:UDP-N-acetylmuramate-alanine ligase